MFGGSDADDLPSIDELIDDVTTRGEIIPPDVARSVERHAVMCIKHDAGHRFEADGFDISTCREAIQAVERDGFEPSIWYTNPSVATDIKRKAEGIERPEFDKDEVEFYDGPPSVDGVPVKVAAEGVFRNDVMLLIGEGSIGVPPVQVPTRPVIVREPSGVAVIYL